MMILSPALVFVLFFINVNAKFNYEGVKMFECDSYTRRECSQVYSNDKHLVFPSGTTKILRDQFSNKKGLLDVIGTPGRIAEIETGSFSVLPKLKRIWLGGQNLQTIKYGIFNGLPIYYLYLSANQIETIEVEALDMKKLRKLYLDRNRLSYFDPNWFTTNILKSLAFLYLSHNKIKTINRKSFYRFPRLTKIDFSYNQIEYISTDIFHHEADIDSFDLTHNRLKTLDPLILKGVNYIEEFSISYNFLKNLEPSLMNSTIINTVNVYPNLWKCSCISRFEAALLEKHIEPNQNNALPNNVLCFYDSNGKCTDSDNPADAPREEALLKKLTEAYDASGKKCKSDNDCADGKICKSDYCWPLISEAYFSLSDDYYFLWNFY